MVASPVNNAWAPAPLALCEERACRLGPDESAEILTERLRQHCPFFFLRYGDGALEAIYGRGTMGRTCDGEQYSRELGEELLAAWRSVMERESLLSEVFVGEWRSASFQVDTQETLYAEEYDQLLAGYRPSFLHFEALLVMRKSYPLVDFYWSVKIDQRKKVLMGPACMAPAARSLGARHVATPMQDLFRHRAAVERELMKEDFDVLLYGAGLAGNLIAAHAHAEYPERTYVSIGSALDPLYRGKSRRQQLSQAEARKMFAGVFE